LVPYNMLQAVGRPDLTGRFHLLQLPFYVVICLLLIPRWGIAGAALASTCRFVLDAGLLFWAVRRYCNCFLMRLWTRSLRVAVVLNTALGIELLAIRLWVPGPWVCLGAGVLSLSVYFVLVWIFIIETGEKPAFSAALRMFGSQEAS